MIPDLVFLEIHSEVVAVPYLRLHLSLEDICKIIRYLDLVLYYKNGKWSTIDED